MSRRGANIGNRVPVTRPADERSIRAEPGMKTKLPTQQEKLMYMLERLDEPLYMGPKGAKQNVLFEDSSQQMATETVTKEVKAYITKKQRNLKPVKISKPKKIPDLSYIRAICPRKGFFSFFVPVHQQAFRALYDIFMGADSVEEFINIAAYCRDNSMINPHLFLYAYSKALLARNDTRGFKFPALFEVLPDAFVNTVVIKQAQELSRLPEKSRKVISANGPAMMSQAMDNPDKAMNPDVNTGSGGKGQPLIIGRGYTGRDFNPENRMSYFREDMGVNSHHHHWHLVYDRTSSQNRRGELFYYMHHNLIARYDAERLSNGLARLKKLDLACRPVLEEGYFSKLTLANSKMAYAGRQANTPVTDVYIQPDPDANVKFVNKVEVEDIRKHKDRILEAIDTGYLIKREVKNGKELLTKLELAPNPGALDDPGIDLLGNVLESNHLSVNMKFYGSLHVEGHILMANLHDPEGHHKESFGPVGDLPTAMRDPAFYRWHKFVDDIFDHYKQQLQPYSEAQLRWDPVKVRDISVRTDDMPGPNVLITHWMQSDIDLGRGLDIKRNLLRDGPVWARMTHLNHKDFQYKINVENTSSSPVRGTFRIFMAPRDNEHGQRLYYIQQRLLFFEMDKFAREIPPGRHEIIQKSADSSVTIPWEQSFKTLEDQIKATKQEDKNTDTVCGCGWPQHMLLPRGLPEGMFFDLFVIVTNADEDTPKKGGETNSPEVNPTTRVTCKESLSFCGVKNEDYPDTKPMGFPFDRNPLNNKGANMDSPPDTLKDYILPDSNMKVVEVQINHQPFTVTKRGNGAPDTMPVMPPQLATSKRTQNKPPARESRESLDYFNDY
ncbi:unnamed protein product [Allacma fusca]|uniref:Tyrosinase copper-binding domain-containing protein n=1 Tax=Allacma fusca TaxID=39272 RepID=A0A8J2LRD0_9HEXA|nr:unnamed protein product [Allacma fusca]